MHRFLILSVLARCWHHDLSAIPRDQMLPHVVADNDADVRRQLAGRWDGRDYGYNGDSPTFEGEEGDGTRQRLELSSSGEYVATGDCSSRGHYDVQRDQDDVTLTLVKQQSCAANGPKTLVYYVHHLDADILVLIDGSTAGVVAFRRVDP